MNQETFVPEIKSKRDMNKWLRLAFDNPHEFGHEAIEKILRASEPFLDEERKKEACAEFRIKNYDVPVNGKSHSDRYNMTIGVRPRIPGDVVSFSFSKSGVVLTDSVTLDQVLTHDSPNPMLVVIPKDITLYLKAQDLRDAKIDFHTGESTTTPQYAVIGTRKSLFHSWLFPSRVLVGVTKPYRTDLRYRALRDGEHIDFGNNLFTYNNGKNGNICSWIVSRLKDRISLSSRLNEGSRPLFVSKNPEK